jgi:hypothetical protein
MHLAEVDVHRGAEDSIKKPQHIKTWTLNQKLLGLLQPIIDGTFQGV